ncbi:MAG: TetR/AcrR family transcriptional regulator [Candidatus Wallbacteria bacterium]|nr:TetR/AcrR family transcriptional regulator [Candidatus Wallbacteria bacterium]
MSPERGSRRQVRSRKPAGVRRGEIAQAAFELLSSHRVREFTAQAVARKVGISDAALFRHFSTMDGIVGAVVDKIEQLLFEGFPPVAADPLERLGLFFAARVAALRRHPGLSRLVFFEHLAQAAGAADLARVRRFREKSIRFVAGCLEEARQGGLLAPGFEVRPLTTLVVGALLATGHASGGASGRLDADAARVWRTLEALIRRPRPAQPVGPRSPRRG